MKSSLEQLRGRNNSDVTSSDHNEGDDTRYYERPPLQRANRPELSRKRQRIMHACDECRRKKIKCDGRKPCFHCSVYGYGETQLSNSHLKASIASLLIGSVIHSQRVRTTTLQSVAASYPLGR